MTIYLHAKFAELAKFEKTIKAILKGIGNV